jgi:hypothetical protein
MKDLNVKILGITLVLFIITLPKFIESPKHLVAGTAKKTPPMIAGTAKKTPPMIAGTAKKTPPMIAYI